jgi:hypothetical protein
MVRPEECCDTCPISKSSRRAKGNADDCTGPWRIMRAAVVTTISRDQEVRPTDYAQLVCGREIQEDPLQAGPGERIFISPKAERTDALIISGPGADRYADTSAAQGEALVDQVGAQISRGYIRPASHSMAGEYPRGLTSLPGGADIAHVKGMISALTTDDFLEHIAMAVQKAEEVHTLLGETLHGTNHPSALGALSLAGTLHQQLLEALSGEMHMRAEGRAYLEES